MNFPIFSGDPRQHLNYSPSPGWFDRDMGDRLVKTKPQRRWRLPIWPGFRLELRILPARGAEYVQKV